MSASVPSPTEGGPGARPLLALLAPPDPGSTPAQGVDGRDWPGLVALAGRHGVAPLLYDRLRAGGELAGLPESAQRRLATYYWGTKCANLLALAALDEIIAALGERGISPLLLKGAGLHFTVYGDPGLRPMDDLDLLVGRAQLAAAGECLQGLGYEPRHVEPFPGAFAFLAHHLELQRPRPVPQIVELHHHWLELPPTLRTFVAMDGVIGRGRPIETGRGRACIPELHDQVLHLTAHLANQETVTGRLIWCCDIDRTIRAAGAGLDWDLLLARARAYRMVAAAQRVWPVLAGLLATPVPPAVLDRLPELPLAPVERRHYEHRPVRYTRLGDGWRKLKGVRGADRLRCAWGLLFPSPSYMAAFYGSGPPFGLGGAYLRRLAAVAAESVTAARGDEGRWGPRGRLDHEGATRREGHEEGGDRAVCAEGELKGAAD